jgi:hypothetical protein
MQKLLAAYRANPTDANRTRLLKYAGKHPFAMILLPIADQQLLNSLL